MMVVICERVGRYTRLGGSDIWGSCGMHALVVASRLRLPEIGGATYHSAARGRANGMNFEALLRFENEKFHGLNCAHSLRPSNGRPF
jgi:hypothetical protein